MYIVILNKSYSSLEFTVRSQNVYVVKELPGRKVSGVRFASEDYLDWMPSISDNLLETFYVMED
jgi:hypothetical protein